MRVASGLVQVELRDGVQRITLARPPLNVLTTDMMVELTDAVNDAASVDARVVLITGEQRRAFCAGVDVADHTPERVAAMMTAFQRLIHAVLESELPVVCALNGAALGGGLEVALAGDVVLARQGAAVGQPEIRLGVFPPAAAALLPRLIGRQRALDLILTGRTVMADEAYAMGLVTRVLPADGFETQVDEYVGLMAAHSGAVLRLARRAVAEGLALPLHEAIAGADRIYLDELMRLEDAHEGLAAFMEKRQPAWRHQ